MSNGGWVQRQMFWMKFNIGGDKGKMPLGETDMGHIGWWNSIATIIKDLSLSIPTIFFQDKKCNETMWQLPVSNQMLELKIAFCQLALCY